MSEPILIPVDEVQLGDELGNGWFVDKIASMNGRIVLSGPNHSGNFTPGERIHVRRGSYTAIGERGLAPSPIPMRLTCPSCGALHLDVGDFATKPHHTHACQACGMVWRPAVVPTVGVQFLPDFKNGGA